MIPGNVGLGTKEEVTYSVVGQCELRGGRGGG